MARAWQVIGASEFPAILPTMSDENEPAAPPAAAETVAKDVPVVSAAAKKEEAPPVTDDEELPPLLGTNDDDDDDDRSTSSTQSDEPVVPDEADKLLLEAASLKELGNAHFQQGELDQAARSYRQGCNKLKKLNRANTGDEQVKALLTALQTNLAMVLFRKKSYRQAAQVAAKVIERDPTHVKALFRRACAYRCLGEVELARDDLRAALKVDPANAACKKELAAVKKELERSKENQRKALSKAFQGSSLYNDKEAQARKKEEREQQRKKEAQELYKKRKQEWEDECAKRMAANKEPVTFEDWEKERQEEEERLKKEEEERKKEEERLRKEELKKKREAEKANKKEDSDSDDDELTEQELAMMRGYKKTKDGRTTSYFTREVASDVKFDIAPKRLDDASSTQSGPVSISPSNGSSAPSAWNSAGTWEDRDTTLWCTDQLRKRLLETSLTTETVDVDIAEVDKLSGHASVALTAGKKRYIFEYDSSLKYEMKSLESDKVIASGKVRLPDICSAMHDELEVTFDAFTKRPATEFVELVDETKGQLAAELRRQVQRWVDDFNKQY